MFNLKAISCIIDLVSRIIRVDLATQEGTEGKYVRVCVGKIMNSNRESRSRRC
ncbi:hypothetical protein LINPERPRIM_LOCUS33033 [Linum perenne]